MYLRTSASDLDAYRYFRGSETMDLDALKARLRRQEPPSPAMEAGRAFHKALENSTPCECETLEADDHVFRFNCDAELALPDFREVKSSKDYVIDGITVTLVGIVDAIQGRTVFDHKLTSRFDPDRYLNSYQWRTYLDVFDADRFVWNVFEGRESAPQEYTIRTVHELGADRYPGLLPDLTRELQGFVDLCRAHLPEKITEAPTWRV